MSGSKVASWLAYWFLRRQVRWSGIPISFKNFPDFVVIHTVKGFGIVNKAEVDVFLELSCFIDDPTMLAIWSLLPLPFLNPAWTSGSSLLKPCLKNFEHYFASMWDECSCAVVWIFFGIAFFLELEWKLTLSSPVATPLPSFGMLSWVYEILYWKKKYFCKQGSHVGQGSLTLGPWTSTGL